MSIIRPFDVNTTISRTQDISQIHSQEQNKSVVNNQNFQNEFKKEVERNSKSVENSEKSEQKNEKFDAKEEGKNKYLAQRKEKKSKSKGTVSDKNNTAGAGTYKGFDVKI